tara:strand:- start:2631 stop:3161 length:531 start_codon:yes stop_codon:yes gene_type:complete
MVLKNSKTKTKTKSSFSKKMIKTVKSLIKRKRKTKKKSKILNVDKINKIPEDNLDIILKHLNPADTAMLLNASKKTNKSIKNTQAYEKYKKNKEVYKIQKYKGLWRPLTTNIYTMSRRGIINDLKNFRDAWEDNLGINQDLSDEYIDDLSTYDLLERLDWYYSDETKQNVENILDI